MPQKAIFSHLNYSFCYSLKTLSLGIQYFHKNLFKIFFKEEEEEEAPQNLSNSTISCHMHEQLKRPCHPLIQTLNFFVTLKTVI